jgi:hypothetical protein
MMMPSKMSKMRKTSKMRKRRRRRRRSRGLMTRTRRDRRCYQGRTKAKRRRGRGDHMHVEWSENQVESSESKWLVKVIETSLNQSAHLYTYLEYRWEARWSQSVAVSPLRDRMVSAGAPRQLLSWHP